MSRRSKQAARRRQARTEASQQAFVQYGPQEAALSQLLRDARSEYITTVRQARGASRGIRAAAKAALPKVKKDYGAAQETRASAQRVLDQDLAALGPAADRIKAASAREQAGARTRIAESEASALKEFRSRASQAAAGAAFAEQSARGRYHSDRAKIGQQVLDLSRQRGVFTSAALRSTLDALRKEAQANRGLDIQAAGQRETGRHNRATETQAAADAAGKPKKGRPTRKDKVAAHTQFEKGVNLARTLRKGDAAHGVKPASESEIVTILSGKDIAPVLARAAAQYVLYRGVGPKTRKTVYHRYGVKFPAFPKRPKASGQAAQGSIGGGSVRAGG